MAGKTFTGIGIEDLLKEIPPVGPDGAAPEATPASSEGANQGGDQGGDQEGDDIRGVYSGPTVVDDDKVAEGLKRLRSLERTTAVGTGPPVLDPVPVGEVSELVADMDSSEPTKIGMPHQRATAVGRSLSDDVPGQQMVVPPDNLRGTMFGHSVHLPDLHIPIDADEVSSSGPIYVPPKPATTTQLVRYQQPAPARPSVDVYPMQAQPFHRGAAFPSHEPDLRTETIPPLGRRMFGRAAAMVVGLVVVGGAGALAFRYYRANEAAASAPSADPPVSAAEPSGQQPGVAQVPAAPSEPAGVVAAPPGAAAGAEGVPPSAAKPSPASDPPLGDAPPPRRERPPALAAPRPSPSTAADDDTARTRRRPARAERRRAAAADAPTTDTPTPEAPPKPAPRKKAVVDEDPDATLPPSTVE